MLVVVSRQLSVLGCIQLPVDDCGPHLSTGSDLMYSTQRLTAAMRCSRLRSCFAARWSCTSESVIIVCDLESSDPRFETRHTKTFLENRGEDSSIWTATDRYETISAGGAKSRRPPAVIKNNTSKPTP